MVARRWRKVVLSASMVAGRPLGVSELDPAVPAELVSIVDRQLRFRTRSFARRCVRRHARLRAMAAHRRSEVLPSDLYGLHHCGCTVGIVGRMHCRACRLRGDVRGQSVAL